MAVIKRRKDTLPSLEYTVRGFSVRAGRLVLPKGVTVPVVWSRDLPSQPSSVRLYRDSPGHWYASFVVTRETGPAPDADRIDRYRLGRDHHGDDHRSRL